MSAAIPEHIEGPVGALPQGLQSTVTRWLERLGERHHAALEQIGRDFPPVDPLLRFVAVSDYAARMLLVHWPWFVDAGRRGTLSQMPCDAGDGPPTEQQPAEFMRALRHRRNRRLLQVLWREVQGETELPETLAALSDLADGLIASSERFAHSRLAERCGEVRDSDGAIVPLVIVAMGKLGGGELNFSSDVDLVFLYPRDGESDGARRVSAQEYFTRLTRRVVSQLEDVTEDGFVYRVDTRLRPFGESGPPVVSFAALESYLLNHGRSWERYAWIKARVIVPDTDDTSSTTLHRDLIEPFVYRRYIDFGIFESLREMKSMIAAEVRRREMARNIKLGPGGIREIEFIVQSLQLVRGGSVRRLRSSELMTALRELEANRGLRRETAEGLAASYTYLRRLENFLQAMHDRQVHDLPDAGADRARLVLAMRERDWASLEATIDEHRRYVGEQFAAIAFRGEDDALPSDVVSAVAARCEVQANQEEWRALFAGHGFREADDMAQELTVFLSSRATQQIDSVAHRRLSRLLPMLLSRLQPLPHPTRVLKRLLEVLGQVLRRSAYVALLNENAAALSRLVDLCEKSAWLAEEIARYPLLLDEMLDARLYSAELTAESLRADLEERLMSLGEADSERRVEVLGQFQRASLFRIAAADFTGNLPIMKVSDRLTDLAEIVLETALDIAWRDLAARFGEPRFVTDDAAHGAGLGVIAYGKLGGIELSYGSDLDLVFLHDSRGSGQQTNGARVLDNSTYFLRLVRRLVHFLTVQTGSGVLYEVDTRLRPSGRSGLLVTSVAAFERYQTDNAWTWEHQALLRARAVAGSAAVAREFDRIRATTLRERVNRRTLGDAVRGMRQKMRANLDQSSAEVFDLKQGAGGIGDIEFLVQYLVLQHARRHPALIHYSDNIRQLGTLGACGCLPQAEVTELQDIYRRYRLRLHKLLLDERPPLTPQDEFTAERTYVRRLWNRVLGDPQRHA